MDQVLICNSERDEIDLIQAAIGTKFTLRSMTFWDEEPLELKGIDAILLDTNFTETHGFDFLMEVCGNSVVPVLLITAPDEPRSAIEARRIGAFNYCVKTDKLYTVLEIALREMIFASNDLLELKRTILAQKARIAELELQLSAGNGDIAAARSSDEVSPDSKQKRAPILQEIATRLKSGEINLPAFPSISIELDKLVQNDATVEEIAALLKKDMTVSAKLISAANSPCYGGIRQSATVEQAISVLGLSTAKELVDVIANRSLYTVCDPKYQNELNDLWQHGLACAQASRLIAESAKLAKPGEVFFAGLLHDIGKLLLLQIISELQTKNAVDPNVSKDSLDEFIFKHHGVFGRKLIEKWKLPSPVAQIAQYHQSIDQAPTVSHELRAVYLGNLLAKRAGYGTYKAEKDNDQVINSAKPLGLDMASIEEVQGKLEAFMEETSFD